MSDIQKNNMLSKLDSLSNPEPPSVVLEKVMKSAYSMGQCWDPDSYGRERLITAL